MEPSDPPPTAAPQVPWNPQHLAELKKGRESWNAFVKAERKKNPQFWPNLSGVQFTQAELAGTPLWGKKKEYTGEEVGDERALLDNFDLTGANLFGADLTGASLSRTNLTGANLSLANLTGANLDDANLTSAILGDANLTDASLMNSRWDGTDVSRVVYDRAKLRGKCAGVRADGMYGHALFRRDVMDQDYIDTVEGGHRDKSPYRIFGDFDPQPSQFQLLRIRIAETARHLRASVLKWRPLVAAALVGCLIAWLIARPSVDPITAMLSPLGLGMVAAAMAITFFNNTWWGRWVLLRAWRLMDYGRDWDRVVMLAAIFIFVFGGLYSWVGDAHLHFAPGLCAEGEAACKTFSPWFVAALGFATLGISDLVTPLTGLGQLLVLGNVLSGFVTLGLLLAVLSDQFARRA